MTTHEIISATETPGGVELKITWGDLGNTTTELYSQQVAKALGWKRPDPQPVDPAWMVEVAREIGARICERQGHRQVAEEYRAGMMDSTCGCQDAIDALHLALSRNHVVHAPVMPSEEEMLRDARRDTAQMYRDRSMLVMAEEVLSGVRDDGIGVSTALQARRNVYASLGAVAGRAVSLGPVAPEVDLRADFRAAWHLGYASARAVLGRVMEGGEINSAYYDEAREKDLSAILENLKSGEA